MVPASTISSSGESHLNPESQAVQRTFGISPSSFIQPGARKSALMGFMESSIPLDRLPP